ncbi:C-type lectin domain family 17, member A-like [Glandiceps talaboti]
MKLTIVIPVVVLCVKLVSSDGAGTREKRTITADANENEICHPSDGRLFRFITSLAVPWVDARNLCEGDGGQLAIIKDDATYNTLKECLLTEPDLSENVIKGVWIGLNDRAKEGDFYWVDDSPLDQNLPWANTNPNNNLKRDQCHGQDCVQLWKNRNWQLDDDYCFKNKQFVCEYEGRC